MITSSFRKLLIPSLVVASTTFFAGAAGAGEAALKRSDPQDQARQLLAPTQPGLPVALSGSSLVLNGVVESVLDPQELARRLLAGAHGSENMSTAAPVISTVSVGRTASPRDSQALAQQMILGARDVAKTRTATRAAALSRNALE
jgi:hypothetical protein